MLRTHYSVSVQGMLSYTSALPPIYSKGNERLAPLARRKARARHSKTASKSMDQTQRYIDPDFEFDAPQYHDFTASDKESSAEAEQWFESSGPQGIASPEERAGVPYVSLGTQAVAIECDSDASRQSLLGQETKNLPSAATASKSDKSDEAQNLSAAAKVVVRATKVSKQRIVEQTWRRPSNLVTSWAQGAAVRVVVDTNPADTPDKARGSNRADESKSAALQKRIGFITPRQPRQRVKSPPQASEPFLNAQAKKPPFGHACDASGRTSDPGSSKRQRKYPAVTNENKFVQGRIPQLPADRTNKRTGGRKKVPELSTSAKVRKPRLESNEESGAEELAALPKARPAKAKNTIGDACKSPNMGSTSKKLQEPQLQFKAKPLDQRILQGPTFLPQLGSHEAAPSQAPKLATSARARPQKEARHDQNGAHAPHGSSPRGSTASPGSKLDKQSSSGNPACLSRPTRRRASFRAPDPVLTMPEPFQLESERRHEEAMVLREVVNQQELKRQKQLANFKARPLPRGKPFVPSKSDRDLTVPDEFQLPGEIRSQQRAQYDAALAERERKREEEKAAAEEEQRRRDEVEIKALRKSLQFKARPMPNHSSSTWDIPLPPLRWTDPVSPRLATEARASARSRSSEA